MDTLEAMRLFVRLAERRNFSAAARDMRIKQSTASKWVAPLEAELGVSLVERSTRAVRLSTSGERFLVRARQMLANYDVLRSDVRQESAEPTGRIRISIPVVFGRLFVVPLLTSYLAKHPLVQAELLLEERYLNLIEEGVDLAVRVGIPVDGSTRGRKLADGRRVLVAAPAYLRARGRPSTPEELRSHSVSFTEMPLPCGASVEWEGQSSRSPCEGACT